MLNRRGEFAEIVFRRRTVHGTEGAEKGCRILKAATSAKLFVGAAAFVYVHRNGVLDTHGVDI